MHEVLLSIQGVSKTFDSGSTSYTAVKDVDLSVARGEVMSIIGHPGCGKSTLLGMISGLVSPTAGTLTLNGQPIKGPGADRGVVFQHHALLPWLSVYDNVYVAVDAAFKREHKSEKAAPDFRRHEAAHCCRPGLCAGAAGFAARRSDESHAA